MLDAGAGGCLPRHHVVLARLHTTHADDVGSMCHIHEHGDVQWRRRFMDVDDDTDDGRLWVGYQRFHDTVPIDHPTARDRDHGHHGAFVTIRAGARRICVARAYSDARAPLRCTRGAELHRLTRDRHPRFHGVGVAIQNTVTTLV